MPASKNLLTETATALLDVARSDRLAGGDKEANSIRAVAVRYVTEASLLAASGEAAPTSCEVAAKLMRDTEGMATIPNPARLAAVAAAFEREAAEVVGLTDAFSWWPYGIAQDTLVSVHLAALVKNRSREGDGPAITWQEAVDATMRNLLGRLSPYVAEGRSAPEELVAETMAIVNAIERSGDGFSSSKLSTRH